MTALGISTGAKYVIVGPDGTRAVLNDPADPDHVGFTTGDDGVTGLERAGVREIADQLPEASGRAHGAFLYDGMAFTMKGQLTAGVPPFSGAQDKLMAATDAMDADAMLLWEVDGVPVALPFRQQQPTRCPGRIPKTFVVAGISELHTVQSQVEHLAEAVLGQNVAGGFSSPLASPLTSGQAISGQVFASNAGRSIAWPRLEIVGPCANPTIRNQTTGESLSFVYTLAAGETLLVLTSPRDREVLLNAVADRYSALDFSRSTWWGLRKGVNEIRVTFDAFSAGAAVRIRWRDAWG